MIQSFKNQGTQDIYNGKSTKEARAVCPSILWTVAARKLDILDAATQLNDLRSPPGNHLEKLKGDRESEYSIRINEQYRICFTWQDGPLNVEIINYHK